MATPRTPKNAADGDDQAIPDAELLAEPGVDTLSDSEVPAMPEPLILTDDPASEPTSEPLSEAAPPRPAPDPPRATRALPLVIGGVIAAVIGFGLSQVVPKGWPIGAGTGLDAA